jgi:hemoglobin/transferrin/lactoferrin receptor protein
MNKFILCVFLILFGHSLIAQQITFRDLETNLPVSNASVQNLRTGNIEFSNKFGLVELLGFQPEDDLIVSCLGYFDRVILYSQFKKSSDKNFYLIQQVVSVPEAQVITQFGHTEKLSEVANQVELIQASKIKFRNPQTSADALQSTGKVAVQKSQQGGGSPVLRGFEANKILLVVDGVRMNNAIYRSGHLQNSITIDPFILEQVEVVFGPGSVTYGSDALGGVVHFRTKTPQPTGNHTQEVDANIFGRLSSANQEKSFHADVSVKGKDYGFLTSVTHTRFGDLRMGTVRPHNNLNWGKVFYYADRVEGVDVMVENPNPDVQKGTGYEQVDLVQKFIFDVHRKVQLDFNLQYSTSSLVPRFDVLSEYSGDNLKWAEWNYGPQNRFMSALGATISSGGSLFREARVIAAFQRIEEDRYSRRFGSNARNLEQEDLWVYSLNLDLMKQWRNVAKINYGIEFTYNDVLSEAFDKDIETREISPAITRYPNGGSQMSTLGAYLAMKKELTKELVLDAGLRYSRANLSANFNPTGFYELPFDQIYFNNGAVTGSTALLWKPDSTWQVNATLATAYRIPNVDDYGKVREKGGFVTVPNNELKPEYVYSGELKLSKTLLNEKLRLTGGGFYSWLKDAIVVRNTTLGDTTHLFIDGDYARIQTNVNAAQAFITGGYFEVALQIAKPLTLTGAMTYTYGRDLSGDGPMAHIPPLFGRGGLQYQHEKFRGEVFTLFNAKKSVEDYAPGATDNPVSALENGNPAWWTLNIATSYYISQTLEAQLGLENILDHHYRTFASGLSAPGRNLILGLRASF